MIWTDLTLSGLAKQAEEFITMNLPCITSRISVKATINQPIVNLPDYVIDIVSVTWKGYVLEPYPISAYIEAGSGPQGISSGKPRYYLYSGYGTGSLKLVPAPNETLDVAVLPLVTKTEIARRLVIEVKRLPDVSGTSYRIPSYYRRRLVKDWVCAKAFSQEGNGQNLNASAYYKNRFALVFALVKEIHSKLFVSKRLEMQPQISTFDSGKPGRPVLPSQFGQTMD